MTVEELVHELRALQDRAARLRLRLVQHRGRAPGHAVQLDLRDTLSWLRDFIDLPVDEVTLPEAAPAKAPDSCTSAEDF